MDKNSEDRNFEDDEDEYDRLSNIENQEEDPYEDSQEESDINDNDVYEDPSETEDEGMYNSSLSLRRALQLVPMVSNCYTRNL